LAVFTEQGQICSQSALLIVLACLLVILQGCARPSTLEELKQEGVLHVIARQAPSIYVEANDGATGFEYELARRFAEELGVELRVRAAEDNGEILSVLEQGYAHIGLSGLTASKQRMSRFQVVPTSLEVKSTLIYNREAASANQLTDLHGRTVNIIADSNHSDVIQALAQHQPGITWRVLTDTDTAGLLERVNSGEIDLAVVDSTELALNHVFFPGIKKGFNLTDPQPIAWLFPAQQDGTLVEKAKAFFAGLEADGSLDQLVERFYGHLDRLGYVGARTFTYHLKNRLPTYEEQFRAVADAHSMDWRLLAAIGYQESHWRPNAVSPTGVRGLMMLTQTTASYVGIDDRLDPMKSIEGGARYFQRVAKRIPDDIKEPDRTWFALASYNVGFGHLEDARKLTEADGRNPHRWIDVKEYLPLLAQKEWYTKTKYGYARGREPVIYVQNIRRYYDVLTWVNPMQPPQKPARPDILADLPSTQPEPDDAGEPRQLVPDPLAFAPPTL
jgi:membrane-bound lytic murein transglycosylase F